MEKWSELEREAKVNGASTVLTPEFIESLLPLLTDFGTICGAKRDGYICNRLFGHGGNHIAGGLVIPICAIWDNE